eukprot:TRINITY_DN19869_c0_g1_i1.p1 TRINITY_DN19869_c0_g1~~TRINITY_DN19869_c0_g1_i1.p1  ORF type:complete len:1062 (-),score=291.70 TRINITY_DN19869_c0_g1_i1:67-3186(-)
MEDAPSIAAPKRREREEKMDFSKILSFYEGNEDSVGRQFEKKINLMKSFGADDENEISKPQERWKHEIDNSPSPFIPKITSKPHYYVRLDDFYNKIRSSDKKDLDSEIYHPYYYELTNFEIPPKQLTLKPAIHYKPLEETPLLWITQVDHLYTLISELKQVEEFAVDLEHHSYRSYQGFTCLMQISTRDKDYLIDTLLLRAHLQQLNEVFCDPSIVKVFHGADRDIEWLQADFSVYVVNMFDTGQAARAMELPSFSLAYLLLKYCSIEVDKKYQRADWRKRPLPEIMVKYAREDTHYLLWIYDQLRNKAFKRQAYNSPDFLKSIWVKSRDVCLRMYKKEVITPDSWQDVFHKFHITGQNLSKFQLQVFSSLFMWRDSVARKEDESTRYVLPNLLLWEISLRTPTTEQELLDICRPKAPALVLKYTRDIVSIINQIKVSEEQDDEQYGAFIPYSKQPVYQAYYPDYNSRPPMNQSLPPFPVPSDTSKLIKPIPTSPDGKRRDQPTQRKTETKPPTPPQLDSDSPPLFLPTPSPVLTTEQLYDHAHWMELPSLASLQPSDRAVSAKAMEDSLAKKELSFKHSDFASIPEKSLKFSDFSGAGDDNLIIPALYDEYLDDEDDLTTDARNRRNTRAAVRQLLNQHPDPRPDPSTHPQSSNQKEEMWYSLENAFVSDSVSKEMESDDEEEEDFNEREIGLEDIPKTMAEIYKLSNKTRKQKKKKKMKRKTSPTSPSSPLFLKHGDGDNKIDIHFQSKNQETDIQNDFQSTLEFMRVIGWLSSDEPVPKPQARTVPSQPILTFGSSVGSTAGPTTSAPVPVIVQVGGGGILSDSSENGPLHSPTAFPPLSPPVSPSKYPATSISNPTTPKKGSTTNDPQFKKNWKPNKPRSWSFTNNFPNNAPYNNYQSGGGHYNNTNYQSNSYGSYSNHYNDANYFMNGNNNTSFKPIPQNRDYREKERRDNREFRDSREFVYPRDHNNSGRDNDRGDHERDRRMREGKPDNRDRDNMRYSNNRDPHPPEKSPSKAKRALFPPPNTKQGSYHLNQ